MNIAFLMDSLESIHPENETTSYLMYECNQRGHTVYFLQPHDLYVRGQEVVARMRNISVARDQSIKQYWRSLIRCLKRDELIFESVAELDVLFLRKNPPLIYQVIEFLGPVSDRVLMVNNTTGQILGNSKLYILNFPDIIPETHVSRDPNRLKKIIDDFGGDMVIKPLRRFGGQGVIKVSNKDQENLNSLINYYVGTHRPYSEREPLMVQAYLESVRGEGDVRILMLNGEILGAMRRIPPKGEFRTNIHAGGRAYRHEVTDGERTVCRRIRDRLVLDGLYFVGIDLIGNKLIEVNCVSPGGIPRINHLDHRKLEVDVIDFVEQKVGEKRGDNHRQRAS
jgi:glutathione synthase